MLLQKLDELEGGLENQSDEVDEVLEMIQSDLLPALELFRSEGRSISTLFRFCEDFPRVPFVNCRQFMYLVISLLVLRAGCGI